MASKHNSLSRRSFMKQAAAAIALPAVIPASALGRDGHTPPSERIVMASIGVGGQGMYDTRGLMSIGDVQYVALCDVDRKHCANAKKEVEAFYQGKKNSDSFKGITAYHDFREVLARDDIDAVMIATPDHWHALISIAAAQAGKDIYCEKPLANSIPEGRAVVNAVRQYQRVFQTGSHERSRDNSRYACELVRNGRIGKLHTIRVQMPVDHDYGIIYPEMPVPEHFDYDFWLGPAREAPYTEKRCHFYFRYILDYSAGEMSDRGAHILDLGQLGNGTDDTTPISVEGTGEFPKQGLFNTAYAYNFAFEYANGVRLVGDNRGPRGIRFEGDEGWVFIHVHAGTLEAEPQSLLREVIGPNEIHLGRSRGHHNDFIECVKSRGEPKAPVEVGHHTAVMCHMANIAMRLGKKLKWDPATERFDDDTANRMMQPSMRAPWTL
ncbi:MAG TPA: Gfo/Idh/MocA family oxidoreductase [Candidatus Hydrogenedentes bacterium]|nr:MAG: 4-carboxy-2-hydroxymuconate-6-semialdehyde dehydrogenase [Candidatus Hydrogenedentes bacterium ADurb.Bin170]HNZ48559.1 Gfo/Idh/MocA family oxidoreductase [Candidatus Hydrogenedentota bacterium]HOD96072.1 Gfo/Idh/MocA family oxidoreductase [Candidatus Hydrogenedentota bacterium]HPK24704.1 Gfo/Idh/MocA family oxidoreductase [Candidatus Hydrogenedentota bacterium]HQB03186.1 Gfo/Idh/MocA family oxidoreductase [Candidatus Hydrogenedentota bacterium]